MSDYLLNGDIPVGTRVRVNTNFRDNGSGVVVSPPEDFVHGDVRGYLWIQFDDGDMPMYGHRRTDVEIISDPEPVDDEVIWEIRIDGGSEIHTVKGATNVAQFINGVRAVKSDAILERRIWERF